MVLQRIIVLLLVVFIGESAQTDICSKHGLFPGIARDRGTLSKGTVTLNDVDLSTCDNGARCKNICLNNTYGWNFIEMRVVSHCPALLVNLEYGHDFLVRVFYHFESADHSVLIIRLSWVHQRGCISDRG